MTVNHWLSNGKINALDLIEDLKFMLYRYENWLAAFADDQVHTPQWNLVAEAHARTQDLLMALEEDVMTFDVTQ